MTEPSAARRAAPATATRREAPAAPSVKDDLRRLREQAQMSIKPETEKPKPAPQPKPAVSAFSLQPLEEDDET
ncbi:hypothetical protein imdm_1758 [gamma proteobacterium IMCC2047]|nr:hypothetical protein imdm_1758 [gamma proteobacterium IMCC2047]